VNTNSRSWSAHQSPTTPAAPTRARQTAPTPNSSPSTPRPLPRPRRPRRSCDHARPRAPAPGRPASRHVQHRETVREQPRRQRRTPPARALNSPTAAPPSPGRTGAAPANRPGWPPPESRFATATTRPPPPPSTTACADQPRSPPDPTQHPDATPNLLHHDQQRVRGDGTPTSGEAGLTPATPLDGDGRDAGRRTLNRDTGRQV
jgi:hypothetical protein